MIIASDEPADGDAVEGSQSSGMTKILLVIDEMEVGGSQRQIVELAGCMDRAIFEPHVLYFRNRSFLVDELERRGVQVHCVSKKRKLDFGFFLSLRRFLARQRFDIVHTFSQTSELWTALAMRFLAHGKLITSVRTLGDWSPVRWRLKQWATRRAAVTIANSKAGAKHAARSMGWKGPEFEVIYNGIDLDARASGAAREKLDTEFDLDPGTPLVIFVGRFVTAKNIPLLLAAAAELLKRGISFRLLLVGDGPLRQELSGQVKALGLTDTVIFAGERQDARVLIAACDVLVLCSHREGLSNVVIEAMAEATPAVVSDVGGNPELVISGKTGMVFASGETHELAGALEKILSNAGLRHAMGAAARRRAEDLLGRERMVEQMQACYLRQQAAA